MVPFTTTATEFELLGVCRRCFWELFSLGRLGVGGGLEVVDGPGVAESEPEAESLVHLSSCWGSSG
jgi:hypothetical protein